MMTGAASKTGMHNFRGLIRNAFVTCALDGRRLPFLSRYFQEHDTATAERKEEEEGQEKSEEGDDGDGQLRNVSTELMLFLELMSFVELYGATPMPRRRDIAKRIAYKFFLRSKVDGGKMKRPKFDFSQIVEKSELGALTRALNNEEEIVQRSVFLPFQNAVVSSLCGSPFVSFLVSDECARMRGYLRNTSPYRTVSPGDIFNHIIGSGSNDEAHNHLLYNLVFLLCQKEQQVCGENDDVVGTKCGRVMGAAGGLACAIFIRRDLAKVIEATDHAMDVGIDEVTAAPILEEFEKMWEMFIAPAGGALEMLPNSNETEDSLTKVRKLLKEAAAFEDIVDKMELLVGKELGDALEALSDDLVYDYAVNVYPKFREHPFHEWMCSELAIDQGETSIDHARIPSTTKGCITRLLRKAVVPQGVSLHKPSKGRRSKSKRTADSSIAEYPNAEYAIVFGSDDGSSTAERVPNPALDHYDIRRYTCQPVLMDEENCRMPTTSCRVPATLESYALVSSVQPPTFAGVDEGERFRYVY